MTVQTFRGSGGVMLEADVVGAADDPAVLLIHSPGQTRAVWRDTAAALAKAGRRVIAPDLRGHGGSGWPGAGGYGFDAYVEDLRLILAQLTTRPVVVADGHGCWIAAAALVPDAALLATGLVLIDMPDARGADAGMAGTAMLSQMVVAPTVDAVALDQLDVAAIGAKLAALAPSLAVPVLMMSARAAALVDDGQAAQFGAGLADVEALALDDAGLLGAPDRADAVNALLLDFLERKHPRGEPEFREGSDARSLRDALGCFATGVTIVTAIAPDGTPVGLTANSFTSVSLDPPLLLVCIANTAGSAAALRSAAHFAVNVLQIGQQPASNRFAGRAEDRFAQTPWTPGETGAPVLTGSLSTFECARDSIHEGGDHFILVGRVVRVQFEPRRDPLLYFRGKYRRLHFA